jgi:hypothetical protein
MQSWYFNSRFKITRNSALEQIITCATLLTLHTVRGVMHVVAGLLAEHSQHKAFGRDGCYLWRLYWDAAVSLLLMRLIIHENQFKSTVRNLPIAIDCNLSFPPEKITPGPLQ